MRLWTRISRLLEYPLRFLFGDDIFISYSRADGLTYAEGLASELARRGFSCRVDLWETTPGAEMPWRLRRAVRWSKMLVLVGTPRAVQSPHVALEISEFAPTAGMIVPIDFHDAVPAASWFAQIQGLPIAQEDPAALAIGQPSVAILSRIEHSVRFTRRNRRIRNVFALVSTALFVLLVLSAFAGREAVRQQAAAVQAARDAGEQRRLADLATGDRKRSEQSAAEAREQEKLARASAAEQRLLAEAARKARELEESGAAALREFESGSGELEALESAIRVGRELLPMAPAAPSWSGYPAANPITALNTIVENIRERNRFPVGGVGLDSVTLSANGRKLALVRSEDRFVNGKGSLWVWDLAGVPLWHCAIPATGFATFDFDGTGNRIVLKPWSGAIELWDSSCRPTGSAPGDAIPLDRRHGTFARIDPDGLIRIIDSANKVMGYFYPDTADLSKIRCHPPTGLTLTSDPRGVVQKLGPTGVWTDFYNTRRQDLQDFDITPDGRYIVIEYHGGEFVVLDLSGKELIAWKTPDAQHRLWMSSKELRLATYGAGMVRIWNLQGELQSQLKVNQSVTDVQFTADGSRVMVTDFDTVRLFGNSGEALFQLSGHQGAIKSTLLTPDGQQAITAGADATVRLWDLSDRPARRLDSGARTRILAVSFPKGRDDVVAVDAAGNVTFWNPGGERNSSWQGRPNPDRAAISPDGRYLAMAYSSGIEIRDLSGHMVEAGPSLTARQVSTLQMTFSPDGGMLAISRPGGEIELQPLSGRTGITSPTERWVYGLAFDPSGNRMAAALANPVVLFFDRNARQVGRIQTGHSYLLDVTFSTDGRYMATAGADGTIGLWTSAGQPLRTLYGHSARALSVRFSPDSRLIAAAGEDQTVRVWDVNGRPLATFAAPVHSLTSEFQGGGFIGPPLAFSSSGKYLALGSDDGVTRIWSVDPLDTLIARGEKWLNGYVRTSNLRLP